MNMLHTVNKSPFDRNSLETCLAHAQAGGAILLIEDGIYGALEGTTISAKVKEVMRKAPVYALAPDVEARGMAGRLIAGVKLVDYSGFVDLVAEHKTVQSWL
jgi:tRNA 2-thiouridine synthesizing protein B